MIPGFKIIDDILKGLPENARLRDQLGQLRSQIQVLQSENEKLKAELSSLQPKQNGLGDETLKVLQLFFDNGGDMSIEHLAHHFHFQQSVAEFHVDILMAKGFLSQTRVGYGDSSGAFGLTREGRAHVMKHRS